MALEKDYHVFLEKPMTITEEVVERPLPKMKNVEKYYRLGLYYDMVRFSAKLKKSSMRDGLETLLISNTVKTEVWVYAHSFVRGSAYTESPMVLQKGCHDFDLICWYAQSHRHSSHLLHSPVCFLKQMHLKAPRSDAPMDVHIKNLHLRFS